MLRIGVKVMDEKTLEKKDYSIGQEFEVKKNTANANRIGFSNTIFGVGEKVYVISEKERNSLIQQLNQADEYKARIKELEADINDEDLKGELQEKDAMIANLKARVDNLGKELEDLNPSELAAAAAALSRFSRKGNVNAGVLARQVSELGKEKKNPYF